ncbi:MAG: DUF2203 domain-containing protein [Ktedonobacteraceae bacterium]
MVESKVYANLAQHVIMLHKQHPTTHYPRDEESEGSMAHYFTREEAEALLPQITIVLLKIQEYRHAMQHAEEELGALRAQSMNNGHHLHERIERLQKSLVEHIESLQTLAREVKRFGCELKDPDTGLIDFLSMRGGREIYLCWRLGEERINFWHYLDAGFAGRQPL